MGLITIFLQSDAAVTTFPHISEATIWGSRLFCSELPFVWLLFEGSNYSRVASIWRNTVLVAIMPCKSSYASQCNNYVTDLSMASCSVSVAVAVGCVSKYNSIYKQDNDNILPFNCYIIIKTIFSIGNLRHWYCNMYDPERRQLKLKHA